MDKETNKDSLPKQTINTEGGAYIEGSVRTGGGAFSGRDLMLSETDDKTIDLERLENQSYFIKKEEGSVFGDVYTAGGHFIGRDLIVKVEEIENKPPKPCEPPCVPPYQGLLSFDKNDWDRFFGRDVLTAQIVSRLHDTNFLTVVGPSGSGKSSVVRAGVVPAVLGWKELVNDVEPLPANWKDIIITPTSHPLAKIAETLFPDNATAQDELQKQMQESDGALANALNKIAASDDHHRLIVVDQFEELFTLCDEDDIREAFAANLLYIAQNRQPQLKIILALRADFYHRCLENEKLAQLMPPENQINVRQMEAEELAEAILRPAANGDWKLQIGLVDLMIDDAGEEPGALPLLSHALLETWNNRGWDTMTLHGYKEEAGGVRGAIACTANKTLEHLSESEQLIAKRLFLRLTELGQETLDTRRKATFATIEDDAAAQHVRRQLEKARLIISDEDGVEIAHEALIREWPLLKEWLNTDREGLITHQRLGDAAERWQEKKEDHSYLLTGLRLAEAEQWAKTHDDDLNDLERTFLEASLLAESRRKRNRRFAQIGTAVILTILVMLGIGTVVINGERNNAVAAQGLAETAATKESEARSTAVVAQSTAQADATRANEAEATAIVAQAETEVQRRLVAAQSLAFQGLNTTTGNNDSELRTLLTLEANRINQEVNGNLQNIIDRSLRTVLNEPFYNSVLRGHEDDITSVAFSPDGQWLASGSYDHTTSLWNLTDPTIDSIILKGHTDRVTSVAFSPDGQTLATGSNDTTIRLWNLMDITSSPIILEDHTGGITSIAFSPDGQSLVSSSSDGTIHIWNISALTIDSVTFAGYKGQLSSVAFSPDGKWLALGGASEIVLLWDIENRTSSPKFLNGHDDSVLSVAFSPDGQTLASGSSDNTIRLWNLTDFTIEPKILQDNDYVSSVAFSPDGRTLASGNNDNTVRLWNLTDFTSKPISLQGHSNGVRSVSFSPDGQLLASGSNDNTIRLWNLSEPIAKPVILDDQRPVMSIALSPSGKWLASSSLTNDNIHMWMSTPAFIGPLPLKGHESIVSSLSFSPDGQLLASGSWDSTIRLWNSDDGTPALSPLQGHKAGVSSVVFSPTGEQLASGSGDKTVRLWDIIKPETPPLILNGHEGVVESVAFSPDGLLLASGSEDSSIRLWNLTDLESTPIILNGHKGFVQSVTFSSDSQTLASGGTDSTVRLWTINTPNETPIILNGHTNTVFSVAFSTDEQWLASGSADKTIRLWNVDSLNNVPVILEGHTGTVFSIAFSTDGQWLMSGSEDNTIRIWPMLSKLLELGCQTVRRNLSWAEWQHYFGPDEPYNQTCPNLPIPDDVPANQQ